MLARTGDYREAVALCLGPWHFPEKPWWRASSSAELRGNFVMLIVAPLPPSASQENHHNLSIFNKLVLVSAL